MAFTLQPTYGQGGSYTAQGDRLLTQAMARTDGPVNLTAPVAGAMTGDLAVTSSGTTDAKVSVAAGSVFIPWTSSAGQGLYHAYNDAALASAALASNSSGSNRYDLISIQVTDAGGSTSAAVVVTTGTSSPAGPAVPANATPLAIVTVPTGFTSSSQVSNGNIVDARRKGGVTDLSIPGVASSAVVPNATAGMTVYSDIGTASEGIYTYNGTAWRPSWNMPWGNYGYTVNTASSSTVTTNTSIDVISVTFTAVANRLYKISSSVNIVTYNPNFDVEGYAAININGFQRQIVWAQTGIFSSYMQGRDGYVLFAPSSTGSVTTKVVLTRTAGTGGGYVQASASSTNEAYLLVEDIGPAGTPA